MTQTRCQELQEKLMDLKSLLVEYNTNLKKCVEAGDFTELAVQKDQISTELKELKVTVGVDNYLRYKIAQKIGADYVYEFKDGLAVAFFTDDSLRRYFKVVNREGNSILSGRFKDGVEDAVFHGGFIVVTQNNRVYILDKKGRHVFTKRQFPHGFAYVDYDERRKIFVCDHSSGDYYYRVRDGQLVNDEDFDVEKYEKEYKYFQKMGDWPVHADGTRFLEDEVESDHYIIIFVKNSLVAVNKGLRWIFYDRSENRLTNDFLRGVDNVETRGDLLSVTKNGKKFLIDEKGNNLFEEGRFEDGVDVIRPFSDGISRVRKGKWWFYVNTKGESILKGPIENGVNSRGTKFCCGRAIVRRKRKWFLIDTEGNLVAELGDLNDISKVHVFEDGFAKIEYGDHYYVINKEGKKVYDSGDYDSSHIIYHKALIPGRLLYLKTDKFHVLNSEGKDIFKGTEFDGGFHKAPELVYGVIRIHTKNGPAYVDKNGHRAFTNYEKNGD